MPSFIFTARDKLGAPMSGDIEAFNAMKAAEQLLDKGITPISIKEVVIDHDDISYKIKEFFLNKPIDIEEMIIFCRQMFALMKAGVPITRAISGLSEAAKTPKLGDALKKIQTDLESGLELSKSMQLCDNVFSPLFISMVEVGENTGRLEDAFSELGRYLEMERETKKKVKQATRYPSMVLGALSIALVIINLFVIPAFAKVFAQFGAELPLPTRILVATSNFFVDYWPMMLGCICFGVYFLKRYLSTEDGVYEWDKFKLRLPIMGNIFTRITLSRFSQTFAMMLRAGIPLVDALATVSKVLGNEFIGKAIREMHVGIEKGDSFTRTAAATGIFTPLVLQMVVVGEETGSLDQMLTEIGNFYEEEVEYDLKTLSDAIEPLLIVAMGGIVLVLALGVFLPMWDLSSAVGGSR